MKTNIKPCPFCGANPELTLQGNHATKNRSAKIKCNFCNVQMIVGAIRFTLEWCEDTVIEKWNKRV